jgi:hypothetical protein
LHAWVFSPWASRLGDGPDPPDVHVFREGLPTLDIEVREYHPASDRVAMEERARELREILDGLIGRLPSLKGVAVRLLVQDAKMPRRSRQRAIAEELVRCIESVLSRGWVSGGRFELSFLNHVKPGTYDEDVIGSLDLSAKEWPLVAEHMRQVDLHLTAFDYFFPSGVYQAQSAFCSPRDDAFRSILEGKERRLDNAIRKGRYSKGESPLWLLIPVNVSNDLSSFVFNNVRLKQSIDECGFDFQSSVFDEVWLTDETGGGKSQCVHPWGDRIYRAASVRAGG